MKRRALSLLLALLMACGTAPGLISTASAADSITVYVTVNDAGLIPFGKGGGLIAHVPVQVMGENPTVNDALIALHDQYFDGGTPAGYATSEFTSSYGGSTYTYVGMTKVWGEEDPTGSRFGFYLNGTMPWDTVDAANIAQDDVIDIVIFRADFSDQYSYFLDADGARLNTAAIKTGEGLAVQLVAESYDSSWNLVQAPVENAVVTTGTNSLSSTSFTTNGAGQAVISFDSPGTYVISAAHSTLSLTSPACIVTVQDPLNILDGLSFNGMGLTPAFAADITDYNLPDQPYNASGLSVKASVGDDAIIIADYTDISGMETSVEIISGAASWTSLPNCLKAGSNTVNIVLDYPNLAVTKTYTVTVKRETALAGMELAQTGNTVKLKETFAEGTVAYTAVAAAGRPLTITPEVGGYAAGTVVTVNGAALAGSYPIAEGENIFTIIASSMDGTATKSYQLTVTGVPEAGMNFHTMPSDAVLEVFNSFGNKVTPFDGTSYIGLLSGQTYTYNVSKYGFLTGHGTFIAGSEAEKTVTLVEASPNALADVGVAWKNFRNSDVNMAVVDATTPRRATEAVLKWITSESFNVGGGSTTNGPAPLLIVDGCIVTTNGTSIVKLNKDTGATVTARTMANTNGTYGYSPMAYGEGMIFVPLSDGRIQAFNASTLASVWISQPFGIQASCPVIYRGGYLYTGVSGSPSRPGTFLCLSVTDEYPGQADETKYAAWTAVDPAQVTGSYWSGPVIMGNAVVYGTDAVNGSGKLVSRNRLTGNLISEIDLSGNQRSSIAYADGRVYCTTQDGYLCSAAVNADTGALSDLMTVKHDFVTGSTSTPVVCNGVLYYGAGTSQGARVIAADASTLAELRRTGAFGAAVQASPLITTCYSAAENGAVYLYVTQNTEPGGIYVVRDDGVTLTKDDLFLPNGIYANKCIASVICDADGVLYYRNDSGYLFAVGKASADGAPVLFSLTPADASVTLTDSSGTAMSSTTGTAYNLSAGTYSYIISKSGYLSQNGNLTISEGDAAAHTPKTITVSLTVGDGESEPVLPAQISVYFTLKGDTVHGDIPHQGSYPTWIARHSVLVPYGTTAADVIAQVLSDYGYTFQGIDSGYISSITTPNGIALSEFSNGSGSGWKYQVNGTVPTQGIQEYHLSDQDELILFYTDNYTEDSDSNQWTWQAGTSAGYVIQPKITIKNGVATAVITQNEVATAIEAAKENNDRSITIAPAGAENADSVTAVLPKAAVEQLISDTDLAVVIETAGCSLELSNGALAAISGQAKGDNIEITVEQKTPDALKDLLAFANGIAAEDVEPEHTVIVTVSLTSGGESITSFGGEKVSLSIPVDSAYYTIGKAYKIIVVSSDNSVNTITGEAVLQNGKVVVEVTVPHLSSFIVTPQTAASWNNPFSDVSQEDWFYESVGFAVERGLFAGTSPGIFEPGGTMTRAMLVTVLYRLEGAPAVLGETIFEDVPPGLWYSDAVLWANENHIVSGYGNGRFGPGDDLTRQQAAMMLYRYAADKKYDVSATADLAEFTDADDIALYADKALRWCVAEGITNGTGDGHLAPCEAIQRAQVAAMLQRMVEYLGR